MTDIINRVKQLTHEELLNIAVKYLMKRQKNVESVMQQQQKQSKVQYLRKNLLLQEKRHLPSGVKSQRNDREEVQTTAVNKLERKTSNNIFQTLKNLLKGMRRWLSIPTDTRCFLQDDKRY